MKHSNLAFFVPHLGCPQRCSFCDQNAITGGAKQPAPQEVLETSRRAAKELGDKVQETQLAFFGGSFTAIPREVMVPLLEAAREAVKNYGFQGIRCSTRPDAIDRETLELLARYDVKAVELGAQSMDDRVLRLNRRGHTAAQTEEAAGLIREFGMELGLQMMIGLYGDTEETALATAESFIVMGADTARIYPTVVLPGTWLAQLYQAGEYRPQTLEEAVRLCARLLPLLEGAGVRVIRMGLSRMFLERLMGELSAVQPGEYTVRVHPKSISVALGEKKSNVEHLKNRGYGVIFCQDGSVERNGFLIEKGSSEQRTGESI